VPQTPVVGTPNYSDLHFTPNGLAVTPGGGGGGRSAAAQALDQHQQLQSILGPISDIVGIELTPHDATAIAQVSKEEGVDPGLLTSIYSIESAFGTNEGPSSAGAIGKMQFMPETWESYGEGGDPSNIYDAVRAAARYLKASGYKQGDQAAEESAVYSYNHSSDYVKEVLDRANEFRPLWQGVSTGKPTLSVGGEFIGTPEQVRTAGDIMNMHKVHKWLGPDPRLENLNPVFAKHLIRAAINAGEGPLDVNSPYRSVQEQEEIPDYVQPQAPPGQSVHQFGGASDIENVGPKQLAELEKEGIEHGSAGGEADPPHTEFVDPRLIMRETKYGPVRSNYAPAGFPIPEGDLTSWQYAGGTSSGAPAYTPGGSTSSLASYSPTGTTDSTGIMDAALGTTEPTAPQNGSLADILKYLESPVPSVEQPLKPLEDPEDLLKLALRRGKL